MKIPQGWWMGRTRWLKEGIVDLTDKNASCFTAGCLAVFLWNQIFCWKCVKKQIAASSSNYTNAVFMSLKLRNGTEMGACESDYSKEKKSVSIIIRKFWKYTVFQVDLKQKWALVSLTSQSPASISLAVGQLNVPRSQLKLRGPTFQPPAHNLDTWIVGT